MIPHSNSDPSAIATWISNLLKMEIVNILRTQPVVDGMGRPFTIQELLQIIAKKIESIPL